jgi:hypothetical protein
MEGPINADCLQLKRLLLNSLDIQISLIPTTNQFKIISVSEKYEYKLKICSCNLVLCKVTPRPQIMVTHQLMMKDKHKRAEYPFLRRDIRQLTMSTGGHGHIFDDIWNSSIPIFTYLFMVPSQNVQGRYKTNSYKLDHMSTSYICLTLNGKDISSGPYTMDFSRDDYMESYMSAFRSTGIYNNQSGVDITLHEWAHGYTVWCLDLRTEPGMHVQDVQATRMVGSSRLELRFNEPLPASTTLFLVSYYPASFSVDHSPNIFVNG